MYTFNKYNNPILLWYGEGVEYENDEAKVQNNVQICNVSLIICDYYPM